MRHNANRHLGYVKFAAAGLAAAAIFIFASQAFAQAQYYFGTGTDIWWAQTNGNPTAGPNAGSTSDATNFSVDGLWNDNLSTGYPSPSNVAPGTFPSINWSTSSAGTPVPTAIPGTYPGTSPNATDPGYIPGSAGHTGVDVVFSATDGYNTTSSIRINYSPTIQGMVIDNTGSFTTLTADNVTNDPTPETITLGKDGLMITSTVGTNPLTGSSSNHPNDIAIGPTTVSPNTYAPLGFNLSASQTWANYSHDTTADGSQTSWQMGVTVTSPISVAPGVTGITTLTYTTGGNPQEANNHLNGAFTDGPNGALALAFTSGQWTFGAGGLTPAISNYSGGLTIASGAQVRDIFATGAGTGTVTVTSGATFEPNDNSGTQNTTYTNPLIISGVGNSGGGITGFTTTGAINSMNTQGAGQVYTVGSQVFGQSVTLTGGITIVPTNATSNVQTVIEANLAPIFITTNPVNLSSTFNQLVLGSNYTNSSTAPNPGKFSDTITVTSPINGPGSVEINNVLNSTLGDGQTVFAGANSYSGPTDVLSGMVQIGNGGATGSFGNGTGTVTFHNTTSNYLAFDQTSTLLVNNPIVFDGPSNIFQGGAFQVQGFTTNTLANAGTTVLNGVSAVGTSRQMNITVNAGTLELNSYPFGTNNPSLNISLANGATFSAGPNYFSGDPSPGDTTPLNDFILGDINNNSIGNLALTVDSSEPLNFSGSGPGAKNFTALGLGAIGTVTYTGAFTPNSSGYYFGGGGGTLNFQPSNGITSAPLTQQAAGTTILGGSITFNGNTNIQVGNLVFNSYDSNLVSTGSISVLAGGAVGVGQGWISGYLTANPSNVTPISTSFLGLISTGSQGALALTGDTSESLDFSSADPYGGFPSLTLGAIGTVNYNGTLTPYNTTYNLGGGGGQLNFNSKLTDVGSATKLVVTGSGTVVLANTTNNYSGGTAVTGGAVLQVNADNELGVDPSPAATNITLNGGTLQASGSFTLNSNRKIVVGAVSSTGSGTIDVMSGATLSYGGIVADNTGGSQALVVTDSGTLALSGPNTYSGGTTVQNGATLRIDPSTNSLGTGGLTLNAGTLALTTNSALPATTSVSVVNPLNAGTQTSTIYAVGTAAPVISGPVSIMGGTLAFNGDTSGYSIALNGAVTVGGGTAGLQISNNGNVTLGGLVGSGAPQIAFSGNGSFTLGSASTLLPVGTQVAIGAGTNTIVNSNNATALGIFSQVTINSGGTLNIGANQTFSSLSGPGTLNLNGNALTLGNVDAATGSFSGNITDGTGSNSALVVASGSTTLSGSSTYTGGTTVSGGTLSIANTSSPATPIGGGTLRMTGGNLSLVGGGGLTQTYANNVNVSANTSVNVSVSEGATLGDLTIGTSQLTVNTTDLTTHGYSLTFAGTSGNTTLNGSPTFIVNNDAGGQPGTLGLGALNDGGTPRTVSIGGTGTTLLSSAANSLVAGTQVNILNATSGAVAKTAAAPPVAVNPISEYNFDSGSSTVVTDNGTLGYNGQFIGTGIGRSPASKIGPAALNLTSANSYVEIPSLGGGQELISTSAAPTSYTVSAWVNASSLANADSTVFSTRNGGIAGAATTGHSFDLQINSTGLAVDVGNGSGWISSASNGTAFASGGFILSNPISTNTWYLVTATVTSTGTTLYLNDGTATSGGGTKAFTYASNLPLLETYSEFATIGDQFNGGTTTPAAYQFLGQIDDVRLYNTALTAAEVAQLYDNITPAGATLDSNNATALGTTAQVTAEPNSTLSVGASQQIQTLAGSGTVALGTNTLTVGTGTSDNSTSTFSGAFTGAGGLTVAKSATGSLTIAGPNTFAGAVSVNSGNLIVISNSTLNGALNVGNGGNFAVNGSTNTVNVNGTLSLASGSSVNVTTGTLAVSVSGGSTISSGTNGVTVATGGTFQIAGSTSALSDSTTPTVAASVNNSGTFTVTGTNQVVNNVAGSLSTDANGATIYSGNTTVGTGSAANLTATQILQNSLTVGNGATVTIVPSSTGGMVATSAAVASSSSASSMSIDSSVADDSTGASAITAIESAVDSGQIGSDVGQALENSVARIDVLSTRDPQLNTAAMLSHVLDELAADTQSSGPIGAETVSFSGGFTPPADSVGGPSSGVSLSGSPAAVPEPSTLVLSVLAGLVAAAALRRRAVMVSE